MGEVLRDEVRERYAEVARSGRNGEVSACCGSGGRTLDSEAPEVDWTEQSYSATEKPRATASRRRRFSGMRQPGGPRDPLFRRGRAGSGQWRWIDVLLSASRVAPGGKAYGLDMTDEMLELARENRRKAGVENAEFLKGEIGDRPLPDDHVDVVISNCSINLSHREGVEHLRAGVEDPRSLPGRALRLRRHRLRRGQRSVPVFPGAKNRLH